MINPPNVGPTTEERPNTLATIPWYLPLSDAENKSPTVMKASVISTPPPTPCKALITISCSIV